MKTSLVIPCTPEHFLNLLNILNFYNQNTVKPDEVVVSLSNSQQVSRSFKDYVKSKCLEMFAKFILLEHNHKVTHGPNRQAASEASSGDLIIYTDADDIPHFKRVEVIKYFFENYDVLHINHWFCKESATFTDFSFSDVEFVLPEQINDYYFSDCSLREIQFKRPGGYGGFFGRTAGGPTSIHKKVLEKVRWKDWGELFGPGEDWEFCFETAHTFRKSMILKLDLIKYVSDSSRNFPPSVYEKLTPSARL